MIGKLLNRAVIAFTLIFLLIVSLIVPLSKDTINAQSISSIWAGTFTEAQATRGETDYSANCASCHAADLRGNSNTPSLLGMSFMFIWEGRSLGELFIKIRNDMPTDRPGLLSNQSYADIVAFILRTNQFPAGENELVTDTGVLGKIIISAKPASNQETSD